MSFTASVLFILICMIQPVFSEGSDDVKVHFIDVGQGDSIFIELDGTKTMLIDAGTNDSGNDIAEYIDKLGYDTIDYLIATHPHADHIGGMVEVFENLEIKSVYMPNAVTDTKTFERFLDVIENENCKVNEARAGMNIFSAGNLKADILSPVSEKYKDLNNYSVVVKLTHGDIKYLFMGDSEKEVEKQILKDDISAHVLKVGHHGSSTSSGEEFVKKVNPEIAIISCGEGNDYGHPHEETVEMFDKLGIKMLRTDEEGSIIVSSDGERINTDAQTQYLPDEGQNSSKATYYASAVVLVIIASIMKNMKRKK